MLSLPGLIDPHVHLRDFTESDKEDFFTGTSSALAGGFTTVVDMPNNKPPITTLSLLQHKIQHAKQKIVCDTGFFFGTLGDNLHEFSKVIHLVTGLKVYFNQTTGGYLVTPEKFRKICEAWPEEKPIFVHAEEDILQQILTIARKSNKTIHVCHVSSQKELEIILRAKSTYQRVTCGVTPHHLFLTQEDVPSLGSLGLMKPLLKNKKDQDFLWSHITDIDCIESDHAPHTKREKESKTPVYGVPGLETTLPLLLTAVTVGKLSIGQIKKMCHINPSRILNIPTDLQTVLEIDEQLEWEIKNENLFTKCKWSPFNNRKVKGKVTKVTIRGTTVFEKGKIVVPPGFGHIIS